ncbi:MAG: substrate-binding domain-containing protein [Angelakisella sp.]
MKHILICLIASVLLFSYIGQNTVMAKERVAYATPVAAGVAVARAAVTAAAPMSAVAKKEPVKPVEEQIGLLLSHADDLNSARFKNGFEKSIPKEIKLHSLDAAGSAESQKTMFNKMIGQKFSVIVLDLMNLADVDYYVDAAGKAGVPLVIIGDEPTLSQLSHYPSVYYVGFQKSSMPELMATETIRLWKDNPIRMNFEDDKWDLTYSALTRDGFEKSGNKEVFQTAMEAAGVSVSMAVDSVVKQMEYDLIKEVDQTVIDDSEIVFFDNSTDVQRALEFFYDPTEFKRGRPKQQFALTVIDDGAAKLVEDGEVLFAIGTDFRELGVATAQLAQLLAINPLSNLQTFEQQLVNERFFYLPDTILRADIKPEPVEVEEEESDKEPAKPSSKLKK